MLAVHLVLLIMAVAWVVTRLVAEPGHGGRSDGPRCVTPS